MICVTAFVHSVLYHVRTSPKRGREGERMGGEGGREGERERERGRKETD